MVISDAMRRMGEREAADITLVSADCYLREGDWSLLHPWDVVVTSRYGVSLQFGDPSLGETTKTGPRQGVRPDRPVVERILLGAKARAEASGQRRLFRMTPSSFYRVWRRACENLGWDAPPPHSLRHTGASFDSIEGGVRGGPYRTLPMIQQRGRWRAPASVLRYSKTHVYNAALAAMPDLLRAEGAQLYHGVEDRPADAKQ